MPEYEVQITRRTEEVAVVTVKAKDEAEAETKIKAILQPTYADTGDSHDWDRKLKKANTYFKRNLAEDVEPDVTFEYEVNEA
jgi:hypothetical protein